jgi:hypothetical protein
MLYEDKSKVKLSLSLTKYHAMKMYRVLNKAPCDEDVCGVEVQIHAFLTS